MPRCDFQYKQRVITKDDVLVFDAPRINIAVRHSLVCMGFRALTISYGETVAKDVVPFNSIGSVFAFRLTPSWWLAGESTTDHQY